MSQYSRKNKISAETKDDALKIARGTQRPGQTKEQTKLIVQGIQKGIDLYKKKQKAKARELDKKLKQATMSQQSNNSSTKIPLKPEPVISHKLPWVLLIFSWIGFATYILFSETFQI